MGDLSAQQVESSFKSGAFHHEVYTDHLDREQSVAGLVLVS